MTDTVVGGSKVRTPIAKLFSKMEGGHEPQDVGILQELEARKGVLLENILVLLAPCFQPNETCLRLLQNIKTKKTKNKIVYF